MAENYPEYIKSQNTNTNRIQSTIIIGGMIEHHWNDKIKSWKDYSNNSVAAVMNNAAYKRRWAMCSVKNYSM